MEAKEYSIRGIPFDGVDKLWRFAEPFIKRALDHTFGEISLEDIHQACLNRDMQLWMIVSGSRVMGAGTTMITHYPRMKVCRIVTLAGSGFPEWMDIAHGNIEMWAAEQGCSAIEAYTRKGFVDKLKDIGYKHRYSVCHKPI